MICMQRHLYDVLHIYTSSQSYTNGIQGHLRLVRSSIFTQHFDLLGSCYYCWSTRLSLASNPLRMRINAEVALGVKIRSNKPSRPRIEQKENCASKITMQQAAQFYIQLLPFTLKFENLSFNLLGPKKVQFEAKLEFYVNQLFCVFNLFRPRKFEKLFKSRLVQKK